MPKKTPDSPESPESVDESEKTPILLHPTRRLDLLARGQELFNAGEYFEAHEIWERLWHMEQGRDRSFVQGLVQAAAHFVHLKKGNWSGARSTAEHSREKLRIPAAHSTYAALDSQTLIFAFDYNIGLLVPLLSQRAELPPPVPDAFIWPKLLAR